MLMTGPDTSSSALKAAAVGFIPRSNAVRDQVKPQDADTSPRQAQRPCTPTSFIVAPAQ